MNRTKESLLLRRNRLLKRDINLQSNHEIIASENNQNFENKHYEKQNDPIHHEKITKRNELFSQLPASTKVSTVSNVEPTKHFEIKEIGRLENHFSIFASSVLSDVNEDIEPQILIDSPKVRLSIVFRIKVYILSVKLLKLDISLHLSIIDCRIRALIIRILFKILAIQNKIKLMK